MAKDRPWAASPVAADVGEAPIAVKSAARTLRILEFFDEIRRGARANEIAERLAIPQSSASFLLNSLVRLGYLDFNHRARTYLPSIRTAVLATWRDTGCFRDGSMLAQLERLAADTGLTAILSTRDKLFVSYLHLVQTKRPGGLHIPLSVRRFAVNVASGIVVLAESSDAEIRALVHRTRAQPYPGASEINPGDVLARVNFARTRGYFLSKGLVDPRFGGIAVALPATITGGWQDMAITVSGEVGEIVEREFELLDALIQSIRGLDRAFELPPARGGA